MEFQLSCRYTMIDKLLIILITAVVVIGCKQSPQELSSSPSILKERIGDVRFSAISDSDVVKVGRFKKMGANFVLDPYQKTLSAEEKQKIRAFLLNDKGFIFDKHKKCLFIPEIEYIFYGNQEVRVAVSTSCQQIKFTDAEGSYVLDYDPMGEEFTNFSRTIIDNKP